jgi:hypothetical protein
MVSCYPDPAICASRVGVSCEHVQEPDPQRVAATAKALHVHVHTVQCRLAKLEELIGLSLRKSEERLTLELSRRIHDLARAGERSRPS